MATKPTKPAEKTWMPTTAGILCLIVGAIDILVGIITTVLTQMVGAVMGFGGLLGLLGAIGWLPIAFGIVVIIGGVYALQRKVWGMALAGAICALIWPLTALGIAAIIFVILSKQEFA